jgi:hypothetical protein
LRRRASARQVNCGSRFYQVARAVVMYSSDFDTYQPLTQWFASFANAPDCGRKRRTLKRL